jgi:RimJ/RimL family protein N-acetyltransferase
MIAFIDVYSTPGAPQILWDLMLERADEEPTNISFQMPTREEHEAYIKRTPYAHWLLVYEGTERLGSVDVTWRNEVGIALFKACRGQGHGRQVLEKLFEFIAPLPAVSGDRPGYFVANINPTNARSIHLFESLGFKLIQHTYALK